MGVKASGELSFTSDIVGEYGGSAPHSFSEYRRGGGEVPDITPNNDIPTTNSDISFSDFYSTTDRVAIALSISGEVTDYEIWSNKTSAYVAHATDVTLTIGGNALVGGTSITGYALDTGTGWQTSDTITIVNNGTIIGRGGNGGAGGDVRYNDQSQTDPGADGQDGGHGFRAQHATAFTNNGSVYGGGGGGAGNGGSYNLPDGSGKLAIGGAQGGHGGGGGAGYLTSVGGSGGAADGNGLDAFFVNSGSTGATGQKTDHRTSAGRDGGGPGENGVNSNSASSSTYSYDAGGGTGGTKGRYLTNRANVNSGAGISGTVAGGVS